MPTVLQVGPYRFFFYAGDRQEPPHIHVEREARIAKFWLEPVRLARSGGFSRPELRQMHRVVETHHAAFRRRWDEYFHD